MLIGTNEIGCWAERPGWFCNVKNTTKTTTTTSTTTITTTTTSPPPPPTTTATKHPRRGFLPDPDSTHPVPVLGREGRGRGHGVRGLEALALLLARPQHRADVTVAAAAAATAATAAGCRGPGHRPSGARPVASAAVPSAVSGVGPCPACRVLWIQVRSNGRVEGLDVVPGVRAQKASTERFGNVPQSSRTEPYTILVRLFCGCIVADPMKHKLQQHTPPLPPTPCPRRARPRHKQRRNRNAYLNSISRD